MSTDHLRNDQRGEGFAFFRWAYLTANPELLAYPGSIVMRILYSDWSLKEFRGVIYGR